MEQPTIIRLRSDAEEQTMAAAASLARNLRAGDVVTLEGLLGSGKTCFVRGLARGLGLNPMTVSSPTFVIVHEYARESARLSVAHIDAYRLSGSDELETIGWHELLAAPNMVIAIEWPSRIADALPPAERRIDVTFEHIGEHARQITIAAIDAMQDRLTDLDELSSPSSAQRACRTCGRTIDESVPTFPFCSERCRLADLGTWFSGGYRMSRPVEADEELNE
jgi:tRNA threonylcarbamoyladenosine biosynthesis protein TsaE